MGKIIRLAKKIWDKFFVPMLIVSIFSYTFNRFSDCYLAKKHYAHNDIWWGSWVVITIASSWILYIIVAFMQRTDTSASDTRLYNIFFVASILNHYPAALLVYAAWKWIKGDYDSARRIKAESKVFRMIQSAVDVLPQLCLQMYILAQGNQFNPLQAFSVVCGFLSIFVVVVSTPFSPLSFLM